MGQGIKEKELSELSLKLKGLKCLDLKATYRSISIVFVSRACLYSHGTTNFAGSEILK